MCDNLNYEIEQDFEEPRFDFSDRFDNPEKFVKVVTEEFEDSIKCGIYYVIVSTENKYYTITLENDRYICDLLQNSYYTIQGIASEVYYHITNILKESVKLVTPF